MQSVWLYLDSRSMKMARGTCFPVPVSEKKVENESSTLDWDCASWSIVPFIRMPCSRQYNSQHELPIWTPAWPTWIEITSRIFVTKVKFLKSRVKRFRSDEKWRWGLSLYARQIEPYANQFTSPIYKKVDDRNYTLNDGKNRWPTGSP